MTMANKGKAYALIDASLETMLPKLNNRTTGVTDHAVLTVARILLKNSGLFVASKRLLQHLNTDEILSACYIVDETLTAYPAMTDASRLIEQSIAADSRLRGHVTLATETFKQEREAFFKFELFVFVLHSKEPYTADHDRALRI